MEKNRRGVYFYQFGFIDVGFGLVFLQIFLTPGFRNLVPRATVMTRGRGEWEMVWLCGQHPQSKHQVYKNLKSIGRV